MYSNVKGPLILIVFPLGKKYLNRDVTPIFDINYPEGDIGRISINDRANNIITLAVFKAN